MTWYDQAKPMMDAWVNAQQEMWKQWATMVPSGQAAQPEYMAMWQEMAQQGVKAWMIDADPTAQSVAEKLVANQKAMMRLMEMSYKVWQDLGPTMQEGGDWQSALTAQMEKVRAELLDASADGMKSLNNINALWQTYVDQWQGFAAPWNTAAQSSTQFATSAMMGDKDALLEMTNLYWDAYQETFGKLLSAPGLGYSREWDEKLRQGFLSWLNLQQGSFEYQTVMANTWTKAFEELMREMMASAQDGQTLGLREFLERWSGTADRVFKTAFASEEYITVQSHFVNMMMLYRVRQREIMEELFEGLDLPTRTEVDEAHRRIYELRREVKALKRDMAALKKADVTSTPAPKKATTPKRTTKKASDK